MKHKSIIFSLAATSLLLSACEDQVMVWRDPDSTVKPEELPLELVEKISRYDYIKNYMEQYHPGVDITVGMGLDNFLDGEQYQQTVLDNFQGVTFGNALKHQSVVSNSGSYNWNTIDRFLAMNTGLKIHGHNLLWHTQQNQTYLKSLIAPTMEIVSDPEADIANQLSGDNSNFDGGSKGGWGSWGNNSSSDVVSPGRGGDGYCMHLENPTDAEFYNAQCAYTFDIPLSPDTYKIRFYAKSDSPAGQLQFQYQNGTTYGSQGGYTSFEVGNDWTMCEAEFDLTFDDVDRIIINFGKVAANYYIDDVEFGLKQEVTNDPMQNVLFGDNSDFEGGTKGSWGSWGNDSESSVADEGYKSNYSMKLVNPSDGSDYYVAQAAYTFDLPLAEDTYIISFYAKSDTPAGSLQFCYQNSSTYSGGGYHAFDVGTEWVPCEYEFTLDRDDIDRILINFGKVAGTYYIDDVKFGVKTDAAPADPMINILPAIASDFEGNEDGATGGWGSWGSNKDTVSTQAGEGKDGSMGVVLTNLGDGDAWGAQFAYTFDTPLMKDQPYIISFDAKSSSAAGQLQFQYQNGTSYGSQGGYNTFEIGTGWLPYEYEFTITDYDDVDRIIFNFGAVGATYYIDNIKFGPKIETRSYSRSFSPFVATRASTITYKIKSLEEKQQLLLGAMEDWIKASIEHVGEYCTSYDVINEPIGDDISFRGINNRGWMSGDSEPEESSETGLNLNWQNETGNGHFYWGYYLGLDYAVKAFEYARKYADEVNPDIKLFVNEYNLETSPAKLAKLIEFVNYIDSNGAHVDGIGTQMHVSGTSITKDQVDEMMKTLASTGKLIRITELDVAMGTASPSVEQQQQQADVYNMILTSYFENIPQAQQHGITIWSLTDNAKEHEYWLNGDTPNIFDANYERKIAYKGVCDAIIGYDVSEEWTSPDYSKTTSSAE